MHKKSILSKDFVLVAIGQIVSLFGNQMLRYALPLYLLNQTGSSALFGTVMAFSMIPMILLFPIGGIIADRVNKRNIMIALDFCTAILIALFFLLMGRMDIVPLMALTMLILYAIQGAYQPAVKASVPALVDDVMRGNAVVDMIHSLAGMAGPLIGGILFSIVGLPPILYVSIGCFFASALMELFIRIPFERKPAAGGLIATGLGDLKDSFLFMFREQPVLWKASLVFASVNLFLTPLVLIGVPVLVTQRLGFAAGAASRLYGYAQGVFAAGAVAGGLLAGALSKRLRLRTGPLLLTGCALSILPGGAALHVLRGPMAIYAVLVAGCGLLITLSTLYQIQIMTYLQLLTPSGLTGKVTASVICLCMCTGPLGQLLYGFVFEQFGGYEHLAFYGGALIVMVISVLTRRVFYGMDRQIERQSRPQPDGSGNPCSRSA